MMQKKQLENLLNHKDSDYKLDDECFAFFQNLPVDHKNKSEIFFDYFKQFHHIKTTECFTTGLFYLSNINLEYIQLIIEQQQYRDFCVAALNLRHLSNDINRVTIWDAIFNYYLNHFESSLKVSLIIDFDKDALCCEDPFFDAMRTAVDHFCKNYNIFIPLPLMDSFYNKESNHYKSIRHLLRPEHDSGLEK